MMNPDVESSMQRFSIQPDLFSEKLSRIRLLSCPIKSQQTASTTINVWRNHAFEPIISLSKPFFAYADLLPDFRLSDYDDTLTFRDTETADVELLWLDLSRYLERSPYHEWLRWLHTRVASLRNNTTAPIVIAAWIPAGNERKKMLELAASMPAVYFADIGELCENFDTVLIDKRTEKMAGTALSNAAQLLIARKLACHWLAAVVLPPIKAIALDLDNTLHSGILGEDGIENLKLTREHVELQSFVKSLRKRGIFLALVSRNEHSDVAKLFANRSDYRLSMEDFSVTEISWGDKASAIGRIADNLSIGIDSILFVDDNPGELASVKSQFPTIHSVHASDQAGQTKCAIEYYPGLWRWKIEADDKKRIDDLKAANQRLLQSAKADDPVDYFRSLNVNITIRTNQPDQMSRLADLCTRTNQFNLALRRFSHAELVQKLKNPNACVVGVQLEDRLSDSGIVAAIIAERRQYQLRVEEICISCRALGRQLESIMILESIRNMPIFADCTEVIFNLDRGPRNAPATDWLNSIININKEEPALQPGWHKVPLEAVSGFTPSNDVSITRE